MDPYMLIYDLLWVLFLALLAFAWWTERGIMQWAYGYVKKYCIEHDIQLLDDNIQLISMRLKRNSDGRLKIWRCFRFEFTSTGEQRYTGKIETLGSRILQVELEPFRIN